MSSIKKSLYRFMAIYVGTTAILILSLALLFFNYQKNQIIESQKMLLKNETSTFAQEIKKDNLAALNGKKYALYDGMHNEVNSSINPKINKWSMGIKLTADTLKILYIVPPPHHLNHIAYLYVEKKLDLSPLNDLKQKLIIWFILIIAILTILGYYLGSLFVKPMKEHIDRLDGFMQDTTHELNTPISIILSNIEMIEILNKCKDVDELKRVKIASKTLNSIYNQLSYLKLQKKPKKEIKDINLSDLIKERLGYYRLQIESKNLNLIENIEQNIVKKIDKTDAIWLIDNLISNAIKYNIENGKIEVTLNSKFLSIKDSGIGIEKSKQKEIFKRFSRANSSEGGFGLGLSIVKDISLFYNYKIELKSKINIGSEFKIDI